MVIYDGDVGGASRRPAKDDAPLIVDADGVQSRAIPVERFESVAGRNCKVGQRSRAVELKQFSEGDPGNRGKATVLLLVKQLLGVVIGEGLDHERGVLREENLRGLSIPARQPRQAGSDAGRSGEAA